MRNREMKPVPPMLQGIPPGPRRALQPIVYVIGIAATYLVSFLALALAAFRSPDTTES